MQVKINTVKNSAAPELASSKKFISKENSMRITSLRFLLSVLVVFIHNDFREAELAKSAAEGFAVPLFNQGAAGLWIQRFISEGIAVCAVPLFFLFSSYLFFMKNDSPKTVLRKKIKSLAVPYFLWIFLNLALCLAAKLLAVKLNPSFVKNPGNIVVLNWNFLDWIKAFFGYGFDGFNHPYVGQLWFARDLFLMMIFSPLLRKVYKKFPKAALFFASFVYIFGADLYVVQKETVLFFTLGYFCAERDFDFFTFSDSFKWLELSAGFFISFILRFAFFERSSVCNAAQVLFACLVFLKFSKAVSRNEKAFSVSGKLAPFSFWLFAVHMPFLLICVQSLWIHFLPMKNEFFCLAEYFCVNILVVLSGTFAGFVLKKICPPLFKVLNGGR